jgi:hypothetical protein
MQLRKFSEIEQFRHVVGDVTHSAEYIGQDSNNEPMYDASSRKPVLTFNGTVKLHGSNCGVAFDVLTGTVEAQSHFSYLSVEDDNFGFCAWVKSPSGTADLWSLRLRILATALDYVYQPILAIRTFGEWCGQGIYGKTAIGYLPVRWVVFGVLITLADGSEKWIPVGEVAAKWAEHIVGKESLLIHFITDFPTYAIDIDFNDPGASLDELERLTLEVEAECPVAKALGLIGVGEGIVWECFHPKLGRLTFKTKGSKHKGTKNSRIVQIEPEVLASMAAFTEAVLTESRLEQGYGILVADHGEVTDKHIGAFLKWVGQDVLKEETDTMEASGLERQHVMGRINRRAKEWLLPRLAQV